jgi:hypothetical protein
MHGGVGLGDRGLNPSQDSGRRQGYPDERPRSAAVACDALVTVKSLASGGR